MAYTNSHDYQIFRHAGLGKRNDEPASPTNDSPANATPESPTSFDTTPVIYVIDLPEHPFDIEEIARNRTVTIVKFPVQKWDDSLTPWPAPGLYKGDADFRGESEVTLAEIKDVVIPEIEKREHLKPAKRAICGYSLGGLFSLYAFSHDAFFQACGCLSGSVWYEGWLDHFENLEFDGTGRYAYFSLGKKECKANPPILHTVQDNMQRCYEIVREHGCQADFVIGPGNHMQHHQERFAAGFDALEEFLTAPVPR